MRIKAIPAIVENAVAVHPVIAIAGVAALGLGVYHYANRSNPAAALDASPTASTQQSFSYGMPQVLPIGGATGMIDAITNPIANSSTAPASTGTIGTTSGTGSTVSSIADAGGLTNLDIFNFEKLKEQHDFDLANMTLAANLAIAQSNADIAMMGIQSANWTAGVGLAEAFIRSGQQFVAGDIAGMTFAFLSTGAPLKFDPSKYASRNQAAMAQINAQQSSFNSLLNNSFVQSLMGGSNVQSNSGSLSIAPTGSATFASSMPSSGSFSAPTTVSSTSANSSSPSTYDTSAYQPSSYGTGWDGSASNGFAKRYGSSYATAS